MSGAGRLSGRHVLRRASALTRMRRPDDLVEVAVRDKVDHTVAISGDSGEILDWGTFVVHK